MAFGPNVPPIQAHPCVKGGNEALAFYETAFGATIAAAAGAKVILEPQDVFWGSRYGRIQDPFGHVWEFNAPLADGKGA